MNQLPDYFQNRQTEICEKISEIVEIESPSHDAEGSRQVARWIESEFAKISDDFTIEKIEAENLGEHLIIRAFESERKIRPSSRTYRHGSPARHETAKSDAHRKRKTLRLRFV